MTQRNEIIKDLQRYFNIKELVCKEVFNKFGNFSWNFFRTETLETLLVLRRDILQVPMTVNNWSFGGEFTQRGFRCNICDLTALKTKDGKLYCTAHSCGCGVDFDAKGMSASRARGIIEKHKDLLPYPIRLENGTNWVHFDNYNDTDEKIVYFNG